MDECPMYIVPAFSVLFPYTGCPLYWPIPFHLRSSQWVQLLPPPSSYHSTFLNTLLVFLFSVQPVYPYVLPPKLAKGRERGGWYCFLYKYLIYYKIKFTVNIFSYCFAGNIR